MYPLSYKVLVVDDMMTMRKIVIKNLKEIGFTEFVEAADGAKAWEAVSSANPPFQMIVSDWNMPNATGLDLLKRVRADGRFSKLPFFLVTAEAEQSQVVEALKLGVTGYIIKPFTVDSLRTQLEASSQKAAA